MVRVRDAFFASMIPRSDSDKDQRKAENARKYYNINMLRSKFMERFANPANDTDAPWQHSDILDADNSEWQRTLKTKKPFPRIDRVMCCPEDARPCPACKKNEDQLCEECEIPMCHGCEIACRFSPHVIPMGLCNDNILGYATYLIAKYKVRWLEAAIVSPVWTSFMVFYVEGDGGHLFDEHLQEQRWRTIVRGSCVSYLMPWEDILRALREMCLDKNLHELPRRGAVLKYLMKVHLNVAGHDLEKHIKGLRVRPFVLIKLLEALIDSNHEVFRGKGSPMDLKAKMKRLVEDEYPETEAAKPEEEREGVVPAPLLEAMREAEERRREGELQGESWSKRLKLFRTKNSTPGDSARCITKCMDNIRPMAMCMDRTSTSASNPADLRTAGWQGFGALHVQSGSKWLSQWCSKYFSQVLPFVFPRMVSGADFREEEKPWRRQKLEDAPRILPSVFVRGFARRVESACRTDWSALPILRSVAHKFNAEHTMSPLAQFCGKRGWTAETRAIDFVQAAQNLYKHLHTGTIGKGVHRVPIAGDTSKLPLANGLTPLEKRMAWAQHFLAQNMPGSQQLRQIMGHSHFGARVVYGDCLFFTISPNEKHSCLVLRLSRFRLNDPHVKHNDALWRRLAMQDFPSMEAKRRKRHDKQDSRASSSWSGKQDEMSVEIELPEYDLRALATARDPDAIVEGYRVHIYLRLGVLTGVRMCPDCPRCNRYQFGCQDRFGSNMRPMGGTFGGMPALGGATEHQGNGTPHFHAEGRSQHKVALSVSD